MSFNPLSSSLIAMDLAKISKIFLHQIPQALADAGNLQSRWQQQENPAGVAGAVGSDLDLDDVFERYSLEELQALFEDPK
ncbi:hypothetical protein Q3G72_008544 [Acer saccharum]|nr:hypothetical protein Q3G72_008544 [Acer saccharum]